MLAAALALAAPLLLATGIAGRLDITLHSAAQMRSADPGQPTESGPAGLTLWPRLTGQLSTHSGQWELRYSPHLLVGRAAPGTALGLRHEVNLAGRWELSRTLALNLSGSLERGPLDFLYPGDEPGAPLDLWEAQLPPLQDWLRARLATGLRLQLSRRLTASTALLYGVQESFAPAARGGLPRHHSPGLYSNVEYTLSRRDVLEASLYASPGFTPADGSRGMQVSLTGAWERQLARDTRARLSTGALLVRSQQPALGLELPWRTLGLGSVLLVQQVPGRIMRLELRGEAGATAFVSPFVNALTHRAEASASATWHWRERLSVRARGAASFALERIPGDESAQRLWVLDMDVGWQPSPTLRLGAGSRALLRQPFAHQPTSAPQWVAFTSLTFTSQHVLRP